MVTPDIISSLGPTAAAVIIAVISLKQIEKLTNNFLLDSKQQRDTFSSIGNELANHMSQVSSRLESNTQIIEEHRKELREKDLKLEERDKKIDKYGHMLKEVYKVNMNLVKEKKVKNSN